MQPWQNGHIYLAGKWETSPHQHTHTNPWDDLPITSVSQATPQQVEQATVAAHNAATDLFHLPAHTKSRQLQQIANSIQQHAQEFAQLITRETGKPIQYAHAEIQRAITTFTLASHEALRHTGQIYRVDITPATQNHTAYTIPVPIGPILAITPFNFPLNLIAHKLAPALAVGIPIIVKPAPQAPLTALFLAHIIHETGIPPGALSVLPTTNANAEPLIRDPRLPILSFTGSEKVGYHLQTLAPHKHHILELGGNAPAIILHDADIPHAIQRLIPSAFASAGQVCIKAQRLIIHKDIYDTFTRQLLEATQQVPTGDPTNPKTIVGPLIDTRSLQRIQDWIDEATHAGAQILTGGTTPTHHNTLPPTILQNVPTHTKIHTEEIFGPILTLTPCDTITHAIDLANDTRYGLQAAIFTHDTRIIHQAIRDLQYGGIVINDAPSTRIDNHPYGGTKQSGQGREGIQSTIEHYTQPKTIIQNHT